MSTITTKLRRINDPMILLSKSTIGEAHNSIVNLIHDTCLGIDKLTEDNEHIWDLEQPLCVHIKNPMQSPMKSQYSMFGDKFIDQYKSSMYSITTRKNDNTDATYTYGNRLCDYPTEDGQIGNGNLGGINQLKLSIITRLINTPNSRRAIAITWSPEIDIISSEPPCLQLIQALIDRTNHLNLISIFRSNDMLSAWGMNAIALAYLQQKLVNDINTMLSHEIESGWLETISNSPHIYYKRDIEELSRFIQGRKQFS
jgi:thymidylate synthase